MRSISETGLPSRLRTGLSIKKQLCRKSAGQLPKSSTKASTSKFLASLQRLIRPSRVEKSMPAASRIRFFTYSGCKAVNIALIVPPMQYPSRLTFAEPRALADLPRRRCGGSR